MNIKYDVYVSNVDKEIFINDSILIYTVYDIVNGDPINKYLATLNLKTWEIEINPISELYNELGKYNNQKELLRISTQKLQSTLWYSNNKGASWQSIDLSKYYQPNPVGDYLEIKTDIDFINEDIIIYNILGQQLLTAKINGKNTKIDIISLQSGVYFIKVGEYIEKIIKN